MSFQKVEFVNVDCLILLGLRGVSRAAGRRERRRRLPDRVARTALVARTRCSTFPNSLCMITYSVAVSMIMQGVPGVPPRGALSSHSKHVYSSSGGRRCGASRQCFGTRIEFLGPTILALWRIILSCCRLRPQPFRIVSFTQICSQLCLRVMIA